MMIKEWNGHRPVIADSAFIAEDAVLIGNVEIGERSEAVKGISFFA